MTDELRALHALLAIFGVALLIILVGVLFIPIDTALHATRLDQSGLCTEAPVDTAYSRAALSVLLSHAPPSRCPEVVSLPYKSGSSDLQLRRHNVAPMGLAW